MKIVCISDTHVMHQKIKLPEGDMLIHAGDFLGRGSIDELAKFNNWLMQQDFKYKVVVPGNHDRICEQAPSIAENFLNGATHYLIDKMIEIEGIKIYGSPWQPEFCNWAFNLPRGEVLKQKWDLIPEGIDVLVTHGPPHGIRDWVYEWRVFDTTFQGTVERRMKVKVPVGCEELLKAVKRVKPKVHIFGHIHDGYGVEEIDGTKFINASICTEEYKPTNLPIVIEL